MDADWDLLAVVRGARSSTTNTSAPPPPPPLPNVPAPAANDEYQAGRQSLEDVYKPSAPFLKRPTSSMEHLKVQERQPQRQILLPHPPPGKDSHQLVFGSRAVASSTIITPHTHTTASVTHQRPKKRKNLQKKVCHVPVEGLTSDMWAWRKYGQKPIKGSPYPRGYYRCSSSKGCPARKQVERNRSTPKMFIVTYTSEHNHPMPTHRNSLAGSTRNKPSSASATEHTPSLSPTASPGKGGDIKAEHDDGDDDSGNDVDFFPDIDMRLDDDFFVGFEELNHTDGGDSISDPIQPTPPLMVGVDFLDEQDWDSGLLHSTSPSS